MFMPFRSKKRPARSRRRKLALNVLEDRRLLAGDVDADFAAGVLTITGDGAGNGVELVPGDNPGEYRVIGTEVNGAATNVTGTGVFIDAPLTVVDVDLAAGSDTFTIRGASAANQLAIPAPVTIVDPSGFNTFNVINARITGNLNITGGVDEDNVEIDGSTIIGDTTINLGEGNNTLMLVNNSILDGFLDFDSGADADSVFVFEAEIDGVVTIDTGAGHDKVVFGMTTDPTIGGDITINLADGNDRVILHDTDAKRTITINGGAGNNDVTIEESEIGVAVAGTVLDITNMLGHDTLTITDTLIRDKVRVDNGAAGQASGSETTISNTEILGDFDFFGDDGVDEFSATDTHLQNDTDLELRDGQSFVTFVRADIGDNLFIDGGIHRDNVILSETTVEDDVEIDLMGGVDTLSILAGSQLRGISTLAGGAGDIDTFIRELTPGLVDIALLHLTEFEVHEFVLN